MKNITILFAIVLLPIVVAGQKTCSERIYYYKTAVIKEEYQVLKKNKYTKHGDYKSYYESGLPKESGVYKMNKKEGEWQEFHTNGAIKCIAEYQSGKRVKAQKFGVWLEYFENGQVVKGFDYDKNEPLETVIQVPVTYPSTARAHEIEGTVKVEFQTDSVCSLKNINVLNSIGYGCDEEAVKSVKRRIELLKKYDPQKCPGVEGKYVLLIHFKLD